LYNRVREIAQKIIDLRRAPAREFRRIELCRYLFFRQREKRIGGDAGDEIVLRAVHFDFRRRRLRMNAERLVEFLSVAALFDGSIIMFSVAMNGSFSITRRFMTFS
jgi:hypothetical protein